MYTRVDSHCHLWTLERGDYGWLDPKNKDFGKIARDFTTSDLTKRMDAKDIAQAVLVQAAPAPAETDYLLGLASQSSAVAAVVGWVDLSNPAATCVLHRWSTNPMLKGVRPMLQDLARADWIATAPNPEVAQTLQSLGLRFDALVLTKHLPYLLQFAQAYPDLPIVIDHSAKPPLQAGMMSDQGIAWRDGMRQLAQNTRACCKLSGLLTEMSEAQQPHAAEILSPIVADLLEWFGPERLMWGSDWPVLTLASTYANWTDLSASLLAGLSQTDQAAIFGGTARAFYGLDSR